ncbi:MAG TPA: VOC family protein [Candidatus Limnocylindrales bacterium]|nr:VOC family protein [Candidatus Limnocylindrales bacterium]
MANASGVPSWIDLATTDLESARDFYSKLFGWEAQITQEPEARGYTLFLKDGKQAAGVGPAMTPGQPPSWTMYVATDDAQFVAAKVEGAGGKILVPPTDVFDFGRMAVFADTSGTAFAVWQAGKHPGGEVFHEPNAYTWSELDTRDPNAAKEFYGHVFGWITTDRQSGPVKVTVFKLHGAPVAGMVEMVGDMWPADLPNHWMNYVAVADTDATVAKVKQLGGAVSVEPTDIEPGRFAVISDPQGAVLSVITRNPNFQPG